MICGKRFALLLLLSLLLLSPTLSAEVCLTDEEFEELQQIFVRLGNRLDEQETTIETLQTQLETAESALESSQSEIETTNQTLAELKNSYDRLLSGHVRNLVITAVISAALGLLGGLLL